MSNLEVLRVPVGGFGAGGKKKKKKKTENHLFGGSPKKRRTHLMAHPMILLQVNRVALGPGKGKTVG